MSATHGKWSSSLFGCCTDCGVCCYGLWCLPCLYGKNADFLGAGGCCIPCLSYYFICCCVAPRTRRQIREKYQLPEQPCGDCLVHLCCSPCAVCQEALEIKLKGERPEMTGQVNVQTNAPNQVRM